MAVNHESVIETESRVETQIVEKEIVKDNWAERIKEAQESEMERINQEADTLRQDFVENELDEIEAQVWRDIEAEASAKAEEMEKKSGVY